MDSNNKILVGKIVAPQGIRGEFRVQSFAEKPEDFKGFRIVCDRFDAEKFHFVRVLKQNVIIAKIDGVDDRNTAESLRGTELFVFRDDLPKLKENEYYQSDLIGFDVVRDGKKIGVADCFQNFGGGDIIELDNGEMVSFVGANVDFDNQVINVK
ncbi:MAG: 16S rRNA processing protein RimM [Alphaproteobacteria bacterium]|nr:16S rRNA processing protein RimM [Alphaproteobacteria bacterium]